MLKKIPTMCRWSKRPTDLLEKQNLIEERKYVKIARYQPLLKNKYYLVGIKHYRVRT